VGRARLGIVVGRRIAPRAVDRARARRVVREEFRKMRTGLGAVDIVIRVRKLISNAARAEARLEIRGLLQRAGRG
jgi:ribonuclease P protein component